MRLRWTPSAAADLEHIYYYLVEHHAHRARPTVRQLYDRIRSLKATPRLGRPGREEGTRELLMTNLPYLVVYRLTDQAIEILHIYHGAQQRP